MQIALLNDIHLNFMKDEQISQFIETVRKSKVDAVLIGGDIGEADSLIPYLVRFKELKLPVYFVLGNHDFYGDWIENVRGHVSALCSESPYLFWLNQEGVIELAPNTALVGHDGWGDARLGNSETTPVILSDFRLINDLVVSSPQELRKVLQRLGDEAGNHLEKVLPEALRKYDNLIVLTHVPPFQEAAWHEGKPSNDDFVPYFACAATGQVLLKAAEKFPDKKITVYCGHTHGGGEVDMLPNLRVETFAAEYKNPVIQRVVSVE